MGTTHRLQGWLTIRGPDSSTVVQGEDDWLDLTDFLDVAIWHQVTDQSNVATLTIETAPAKEEALFSSMASLGLASSLSPQITPAIFARAAVPLARYLRWKIVGRMGGAFSITFRLWIVATARFRPPILRSLSGPPQHDLNADGMQWEAAGGDEVLFDELTKQHLAAMERMYGCDDGLLPMVRAELRRQIWMDRERRRSKCGCETVGDPR